MRIQVRSRSRYGMHFVQLTLLQTEAWLGTTSSEAVQMYGCPGSHKSNLDNGKRCPQSASSRAAVRCCHPSQRAPCSSVCDGSGLRPRTTINTLKATLAEAEAECAAHGLRLCTSTELEQEWCCATGCGMDHVRVWAADRSVCRGTNISRGHEWATERWVPRAAVSKCTAARPDDDAVVVVRTKHAFHMAVYKRNDGVSSKVREQGTFERDLFSLLLPFAEPEGYTASGTLFVDIGANLGWWSFRMASRGHAVVAFEPFASNLRLQNLTRCLNPHLAARINTLAHGLSDRPASCRLYQLRRGANANFGDTHTVCSHPSETQASTLEARGMMVLGTTHAKRLDDVVSTAMLAARKVVKMVRAAVAPTPPQYRSLHHNHATTTHTSSFTLPRPSAGRRGI